MKSKNLKKIMLLCFLALAQYPKLNAQPLIAGEIQSKTEYTYGKIEIRMFSEFVMGTTSTYFWWRNGGQECNYQWNELDIETLPLSEKYQSNPIWQRWDGDIGSGGCNWLREEKHADKATVFGRWIVYTLEWCPNYIAWYHDGKLDRKINRNSTTNDPVTYIDKAMRYCFNLWTQGESPGWLGNLDWNALQNNPVYQYVDYFKYYSWNGTSFNPNATKVINFDNDSDITDNFQKSTWVMGQSRGNVQWDTTASGVSKLSDGNGVLWLGLAYRGQMHAPYTSDLPPATSTTVAVNSVALSQSRLSLVRPATSQLIATVSPANATNKTIIWRTSNAAIATVSATGLVRSVATGSATISAITQDGAKVANCVVTVSTTQTPAFNLKIEAESYNFMSGVQNETTSDTGGGLNVGYLEANDWMAYHNINIPTTGSYTISYRIASLSGGGRLQLETNSGATVLDPAFTIPSTGGWQNWQTITRTVTLTAGNYNLGLNVIAGGFNINWFSIAKNPNANRDTNEQEPLTINENDSAKYFTVYPNPTATLFNISIDTDWELVNISGITLLKGKGKLIDVSTVPNGVYLIKTPNGTKRAIISK
jgi:uncharacterized protein YjdB